MKKIISQITLVFYLLNLAAVSVPAYKNIDLGMITLERICQNKVKEDQQNSLKLPTVEQGNLIIQTGSQENTGSTALKYCLSNLPARVEAFYKIFPGIPVFKISSWYAEPSQSADLLQETPPPLHQA